MPEEGGPSPGDVVSGHVPDWMDSGFFEKVLRAGLGAPGLRVCRSEVRDATGKGENYVSIVYAATVTTEEPDGAGGQHHLIIKCLPSNKARKIVSNKGEFFRKEVDMYEVVLPEFRRLSTSDAGALPWPRHFSSFWDGEGDFLVLEDLRAAGFGMQARLDGLDSAHLAAALRGLGKFHAFSYALKLKEPEVFRTKVYDLFPEVMFSPKSGEMMATFVRNAVGDAAAAVAEWRLPRYDPALRWMRGARDSALMDTHRLLSPDDPGAVLNHGDLWTNNMLFRSPRDGGEERAAEVKLLDFQVSRLCSPAGDLSYLMATSTTASVRKAHWEELLRTAYLQSFRDTLTALGALHLAEAGVYTWPWLQSEMLRYRPFALVTCLTTAQVILTEESDSPDLDSMTEDQLTAQDDSSPFSKLARGEVYQARLRDLLDEFLEEGLFP